MTEEDRTTNAGAQKIFEAGANIAGNVGGTVIGAFVAGPIGAVLGSVAGPLITQGVLEFAQRQLSQREEMRIGATLRFVVAKIQANLDDGRKLRQDDFFTSSLSHRSTADEVLEGVLIAAQKEYEEKKLRFYSNLLANIAFDTEIDRPLANQLIRKSTNLSYQQLCLLTIFIRRRDFSQLPDRIIIDSVHKMNIGESLYELFQEGMFHRSNSITPDVDYAVRNLVVNPTQLGETIHNLMELQTIEAQDLEEVLVKILR